MAINVTISESGNEELENRVEKLEAAVDELVSALEMVLKRMVLDKAASGELGKLEPCDCGDPNCVKQQAYEASQKVKEAGGDDIGSGGAYL